MSRNPDKAKSHWWSKSRGLDPAVYDSFVASLAAQPGRPTRILAWARTPNGVCIGTPSTLSFDEGASWTHVGWHEIEKGEWNSETQALRWSQYGGKRGTVTLQEPGRMPELFRERVAASIVLEKFVPLQGKRGVTLSGRRDLGSNTTPIDWHATLGRGLSWDGEGVRAAADQAMADLRTEYDMDQKSW